MTLGAWKKVRDGLGVRAKEVDFVYITVDPKRDTEERLRERLATFSPDFIGLSGTPAELDKVYRSYDVDREEARVPGNETEYVLGHTSTTFVIDRRGRSRLALPYLSMTGGDYELAEGVGKLLSER